MQYLAVPTPDVTSPLDMDERQARIILSMIVEPGDLAIAEHLTHEDAAVVLASILRPDYDDDHAEVAERWRSRVPDRITIERTFHALEQNQIETVIPGDEFWPDQLDDLAMPPIILYAHGNVAALDTEMVAIVGSRSNTAYGEAAVRELVPGCIERGYSIVSGGAYGIDSVAHRLTLHHGGTTIMVMAGGLPKVYPAGHQQLADEVRARHGALISEVPPFTSPNRWRFLQRNRIIAALSSALVVVEAGIRSGSLNAAGHAIDLARPLGAVPGPITSAASNGANELLRNRSVSVVTSSSDLIDLAGGGI